jgi:hypothetical protein
MKTIITLLLLICSTGSYAQNYLKPNEQAILTFKTRSGKTVMLAKDKANAYIIYRFGSKDKPELEYPAPDKFSWKRFTYAGYCRGGGKRNAAMDLNYIYFTIDHYRYNIYDTYHSESEEFDIGVTVTDLNTKKEVDIKGQYKTRRGSIAGFRTNGLLPVSDELP